MDICTQILIDRRDAKISQNDLVKAVPGLQRAVLTEIERGNVVPDKELGKAILAAIAEHRTHKEETK